MLTYHTKQKVLNIISSVLGAPDNGKPDEHIYFCPFCSHHKKKMNINVENQKWHCWVCESKGKRITSLLRKLNVDGNQINIINKIYGDSGDYVNSNKLEEKIQLFLPKEFRQLSKPIGKYEYEFKKALNYIKSRDITDKDIVKYNIGFCDEGIYRGRIIIPSYSESGKLNYFIARTIHENESYHYKNPPVSRDIIAFGNQINWDEPITLVEGAFDAIAVKRNVIPLFGKVIPKVLMNMIFEKKVKEINIMLDLDAQKQALFYTDYFTKQNIKTKNIIPTSKDAGEMGFSTVNQIIKTSKETKFEDIISQKLNLL